MSIFRSAGVNTKRKMKKFKHLKILDKKKNIGVKRLTFLDESFYSIREQHIKSLPANETLTEEEFQKILNYEKKKGTKDYSFFSVHGELHSLYIQRVKELYKYEYYTEPEKFKKSVSLSYIDSLQEAYNLITDNAKLSLKEKKEVQAKSKLYNKCKENYLLPFEKDGKKIIGCLYPTRNLNDFEFDEIVFLSSSIFEKHAPYTIQDFAFLEGKTLKNSTGDELVSKMLERMINDKYSDISLFRYNRNHYAVMATKHGQYEYLTVKMPIELAKVITTALLRRMGTDKTNKENTVKRKMDIDLGGIKRSFRSNMMKQSKSELRGEIFDRSVSIRALSDLSMINDIAKIGYPNEIIDVLKHCVKNYSSIAWTGETNSGKTTQLYTTAVYAYKSEENTIKMMTISAPREYDIDGFIQFDVDESKDTANPIDYETLVTNILQQNPKYIILDELKSKKQFRIFVEEVVKRGHPTYTTFHSGSNKSSIELLSINSGYDISSFIKDLPVWINTTLIPKKCQTCNDKKVVMGNDGKKKECPNCKGKGYMGVVPVIEFTYFTEKFNENKDDALDFDKLEKEGKIIWFKKSKSVETLYKNNLIRKKDYDLLSGATEEELINRLKNISEQDLYTYEKEAS